METKEILKRHILRKVQEYAAYQFTPKRFVPGKSVVPIASQVADSEDMRNLVSVALDMQLAAGSFAKQFEEDLAEWHGKEYLASLCNSGSSANLLALSALTSPLLGLHRLRPGDEVITTAVGFPTTLNPILQNQLVPVFVDVNLGTYNADVSQINSAMTRRTGAIFLPHTLGNPFDLEIVHEIAYGCAVRCYIIEDNSDAFGSRYDDEKTGRVGHLSTLSFYPAHHISCGEGGAVISRRMDMHRAVRSFRDWGRDCICPPGRDNTCGKRFDQTFGDLPADYDHKYVYSHIGYNMKMTEMQAAVGVSQLKKLPHFIGIRKRNWKLLREGLEHLEEFFILPQAQKNSDPNWFGFALTVRDEAPFDRNEMVRYLEDRKIATRMLLGGNLTRQPAYRDMIYRTGPDGLKNSDTVMRSSFWIGVCPAITEEMVEYVLEVFHAFIEGRTS